jgi:hypothetical protein
MIDVRLTPAGARELQGRLASLMLEYQPKSAEGSAGTDMLSAGFAPIEPEEPDNQSR